MSNKQKIFYALFLFKINFAIFYLYYFTILFVKFVREIIFWRFDDFFSSSNEPRLSWVNKNNRRVLLLVTRVFAVPDYALYLFLAKRKTFGRLLILVILICDARSNRWRHWPSVEVYYAAFPLNKQSCAAAATAINVLAFILNAANSSERFDRVGALIKSRSFTIEECKALNLSSLSFYFLVKVESFFPSLFISKQLQ